MTTTTSKQQQQQDDDKPKEHAHTDLQKDHKKLLHYYDKLSEHPVDDTRHYRTFLARHKASGEQRCVRIVPKKKFPVDQFWKEVKAYQKLYHPHILHLYETLEDRKHFYFITDRIDHPNIYQAIPRLYPDPRDFDETQVALLVRTLLRTLEHCHRHHFPHTDLTYHDILVDPKRSGLKGVFLCGFGYARLHRKNKVYQTKEKSSTSHDDDDHDSESDTEHGMDDSSKRDNNHHTTMAPEDLFAAPETRWGDLSVFEEPSDIWSLGIITYQLLTRHHPYEDPDVRPKKFQDKAWREDHFRHHKFLTHISAPARDFLKYLLVYKDFDRPTAEQALQHEWLEIAAQTTSGTQRKEAVLDCLDNLTNFDAQTKLEQSARLYIVNNLLHRKDLAGLDKIYKHLDKKHDSVLTKDELKTALEKAYGKDKTVKIDQMLEATFDRVDENQNGVIDWSEFLVAAADDSMLLTKKNLRATFNAFDKSNTGTITPEDLREIFSQGGGTVRRRDIRRLMRRVDENGDGEIDYEEFCDLMLRR